MNEKVRIGKNTVQETLILPLYVRKLCTELYPSLYQDARAVSLLDSIEYDYSALEAKPKAAQRFGALEVAMRQCAMLDEIREYLKDHPRAAIVNLGCGLDQTAEACDNGTARIYNIDFPDVISIRDRLLVKNDRTKTIACDLNGDWLSRIDASEGAIFFAAGVFYYFKKEQALALFSKMARHFPGGRLVFDTAGKSAVRRMAATWIRDVGIKDVNVYFSVGNLQKELRIPHAESSARGYMTGYRNLKDAGIRPMFRLAAKAGDRLMKMKIVRMDFITDSGKEE